MTDYYVTPQGTTRSTATSVEVHFREACPPAPVFLVDLDLSGYAYRD